MNDGTPTSQQKSLAQILDKVDKSPETKIIQLKVRARRKRRAKKKRAQRALNSALDKLVFPNPSDFLT
jgi:hypothetical protein